MHDRRAVVLAFSLVLAGGALGARGADWPSLRGPSHDGRSTERLPGTDEGSFDLAWRKTLGPGYSSVAVAEGRAVTLYSDGKNDVAVAFDAATGRELWRYEIAPTLRGRDGSFDGPIATPALAGGRVFGLGPRGHLFAVDAATGGERWKVDLVAREGAVTPYYGFSASPIVVGGTLIVVMGAQDGGAVGGFDPATGARLWRVGTDSVNHQCPVVVSAGGRDVVVAMGDSKLFGIDPQTDASCSSTTTEAKTTRWRRAASSRSRPARAGSSSSTGRTAPPC